MLLLYLNFDLAGEVENKPRTESLAGIKNIYRSFLLFGMLAFRTLKSLKRVTREQHH